jgi:hypothetical protein
LKVQVFRPGRQFRGSYRIGFAPHISV